MSTPVGHGSVPGLDDASNDDEKKTVMSNALTAQIPVASDKSATVSQSPNGTVPKQPFVRPPLSLYAPRPYEPPKQRSTHLAHHLPLHTAQRAIDSARAEYARLVEITRLQTMKQPNTTKRSTTQLDATKESPYQSPTEQNLPNSSHSVKAGPSQNPLIHPSRLFGAMDRPPQSHEFNLTTSLVNDDKIKLRMKQAAARQARIQQLVDRTDDSTIFQPENTVPVLPIPLNPTQIDQLRTSEAKEDIATDATSQSNQALTGPAAELNGSASLPVETHDSHLPPPSDLGPDSSSMDHSLANSANIHQSDELKPIEEEKKEAEVSLIPPTTPERIHGIPVEAGIGLTPPKYDVFPSPFVVNELSQAWKSLKKSERLIWLKQKGLNRPTPKKSPKSDLPQMPWIPASRTLTTQHVTLQQIKAATMVAAAGHSPFKPTATKSSPSNSAHSSPNRSPLKVRTGGGLFQAILSASMTQPPPTTPTRSTAAQPSVPIEPEPRLDATISGANSPPTLQPVTDSTAPIIEPTLPVMDTPLPRPTTTIAPMQPAPTQPLPTPPKSSKKKKKKTKKAESSKSPTKPELVTEPTTPKPEPIVSVAQIPQPPSPVGSLLPLESMQPSPTHSRRPSSNSISSISLASTPRGFISQLLQRSHESRGIQTSLGQLDFDAHLASDSIHRSTTPPVKQTKRSDQEIMIADRHRVRFIRPFYQSWKTITGDIQAMYTKADDHAKHASLIHWLLWTKFQRRRQSFERKIRHFKLVHTKRFFKEAFTCWLSRLRYVIYLNKVAVSISNSNPWQTYTCMRHWLMTTRIRQFRRAHQMHQAIQRWRNVARTNLLQRQQLFDAFHTIRTKQRKYHLKRWKRITRRKRRQQALMDQADQHYQHASRFGAISNWYEFILARRQQRLADHHYIERKLFVHLLAWKIWRQQWHHQREVSIRQFQHHTRVRTALLQWQVARLEKLHQTNATRTIRQMCESHLIRGVWLYWRSTALANWRSRRLQKHFLSRWLSTLDQRRKIRQLRSKIDLQLCQESFDVWYRARDHQQTMITAADEFLSLVNARWKSTIWRVWSEMIQAKADLKKQCFRMWRTKLQQTKRRQQFQEKIQLVDFYHSFRIWSQATKRAHELDGAALKLQGQIRLARKSRLFFQWLATLQKSRTIHYLTDLVTTHVNRLAQRHVLRYLRFINIQYQQLNNLTVKFQLRRQHDLVHRTIQSWFSTAHHRGRTRHGHRRIDLVTIPKSDRQRRAIQQWRQHHGQRQQVLHRAQIITTKHHQHQLRSLWHRWHQRLYESTFQRYANMSIHHSQLHRAIQRWSKRTNYHRVYRTALQLATTSSHHSLVRQSLALWKHSYKRRRFQFACLEWLNRFMERKQLRVAFCEKWTTFNQRTQVVQQKQQHLELLYQHFCSTRIHHFFSYWLDLTRWKLANDARIQHSLESYERVLNQRRINLVWSEWKVRTAQEQFIRRRKSQLLSQWRAATVKAAHLLSAGERVFFSYQSRLFHQFWSEWRSNFTKSHWSRQQVHRFRSMHQRHQQQVAIRNWMHQVQYHKRMQRISSALVRKNILHLLRTALRTWKWMRRIKSNLVVVRGEWSRRRLLSTFQVWSSQFKIARHLKHCSSLIIPKVHHKRLKYYYQIWSQQFHVALELSREQQEKILEQMNHWKRLHAVRNWLRVARRPVDSLNLIRRAKQYHSTDSTRQQHYTIQHWHRRAQEHKTHCFRVATNAMAATRFYVHMRYQFVYRWWRRRFQEITNVRRWDEEADLFRHLQLQRRIMDQWKKRINQRQVLRDRWTSFIKLARLLSYRDDRIQTIAGILVQFDHTALIRVRQAAFHSLHHPQSILTVCFKLWRELNTLNRHSILAGRFHLQYQYRLYFSAWKRYILTKKAKVAHITRILQGDTDDSISVKSKSSLPIAGTGVELARAWVQTRGGPIARKQQQSEWMELEADKMSNRLALKHGWLKWQQEWYLKQLDHRSRSHYVRRQLDQAINQWRSFLCSRRESKLRQTLAVEAHVCLLTRRTFYDWYHRTQQQQQEQAQQNDHQQQQQQQQLLAASIDLTSAKPSPLPSIVEHPRHQTLLDAVDQELSSAANQDLSRSDLSHYPTPPFATLSDVLAAFQSPNTTLDVSGAPPQPPPFQPSHSQSNLTHAIHTRESVSEPDYLEVTPATHSLNESLPIAQSSEAVTDLIALTQQPTGLTPLQTSQPRIIPSSSATLHAPAPTLTDLVDTSLNVSHAHFPSLQALAELSSPSQLLTTHQPARRDEVAPATIIQPFESHHEATITDVCAVPTASSTNSSLLSSSTLGEDAYVCFLLRRTFYGWMEAFEAKQRASN